MNITRTIVFVFVFLIINVSVFMQLYRILLNEMKSWQILIISAIYWVGAIFTENLFPFIAVIILIIRYHLKSKEESCLRNTNIWDFNWNTILKVCIITMAFKTVLTIINSIYILILNYFTEFDVKPQDVVTDFYQSNFSIRLILFLLIVIFAPFVEEYVFRYYLYDKFFLSYMPPTYAAILSAIIFTIAHYNAGGIPSFFGLALFCNYIYEKQGYFAAVAAHLTFNLSTLILLLFIKI